MWLVKTKWYHTFIYVYWILIQSNTLRILWICKIFIFHILDWTIEDQQQQCWFVVLGRGCVWQLVAQKRENLENKTNNTSQVWKNMVFVRGIPKQTEDKTHMTEPPINRLFISSTDFFSACHWWVCCPSTTGYIVVVEHRWMSTVLQVLHQQTNFLNSPSSSAMSSCVHPRFATVGILRQSYPQVGNCEKHGYEMKSINFIELKMKKKGSNTNVTLSEWIQWEMPKIRKDHPITIYSKMFFSGSERNTTQYSQVGKCRQETTQKSKYTPVISHSNGNIQTSKFGHETINSTWLTYTCRFEQTMIAASHCRFPSWPPRFQIPSIHRSNVGQATLSSWCYLSWSSSCQWIRGGVAADLR